MKRLILSFFLLVILTFQTKGQLDYHAWPISISKIDAFNFDSIVVCQFSDTTKLLKYPFSPSGITFGTIRSTICDNNTGRILLYSDHGSCLADSNGKVYNQIIENKYGQSNEGIFFWDEVKSDTIYSIYSQGPSTFFRKILYNDSARIVHVQPFSQKHVHQIAMTRDDAQIPVIAFPVKMDSAAKDEYYSWTNAIDLYKLEKGNLVFHSRFPIANLDIGISIEFSPNGEVLVLGDRLFKVNTSSGKIDDHIDLGPFFQKLGLTLTANLSATFSADSRYLYIKRIKGYTYHDSTFIFQFDLSNWVGNEIQKSAYLVYADSLHGTNALFQIQLAPDRKIYCRYGAVWSNNGYLSAIVHPEQAGAACRYERHYLSLRSMIDNGADSFSQVIFPNISLYGYRSPPRFNLGPDTLLCEGDSLQLQLKTNEKTHWSNGDTSASIWVKSTGNYIATIKFPLGSFSDTIFVQFAPKPVVYIGPDTAFCDLVDYLIRPNTDSGSFLWNTGAQSKNLHVNQEGQYSLRVESGNACLNADTVYIDRFISPAFKDLDTTLCEGDQIVLGPGIGGLNYLWSNGDTSSRITAKVSGIYILKVRNQICEEEVTYTVHIIPEDSCTGSIYFPNTFTPNGDMYNPYFFPVGTNFEVQSLNIYNRWGQHIYTHDQQKSGWDGNHMGIAVPEGVYFYTCSYMVLQQGSMHRVNTKGVIHVLR